ncbi:MAG TPA: hypothetical protein VMO26_17750 [Vicinamibacterales bacterium]|nr:hypothetical protein [Vicinamibacterales bacterium]
MPFHEAARSAYALDRELVASQRRINVANSALFVAEIKATTRLRASVAPPPVIADERKG